MSSREEISSLKSGSEILYKTFADAADFSCCAGNKMLVRVSQTSPATNITFSSLIPLKPPCCYSIKLTWVGLSTNMNIVSFNSSFDVNQIISGGTINQSSNTLATQSIIGNSITLTKNPSSDSIDISLVVTIGGTVTHSIDCEIISAHNF